MRRCDRPPGHVHTGQPVKKCLCFLPPGRVIKRFVMHAKKTAFVVEHDFIMATCVRPPHIPATPPRDSRARSLARRCAALVAALTVRGASSARRRSGSRCSW